MVTVVVVGAGPTALGVLDRLLAHAGGRPLAVHLVDPHPPGGGRVWRSAQSALLWANSQACDVTVLPDASVDVPGPRTTTLWDWVQRVGVTLPGGIGEQARSMTATRFPARTLVNGYLGWVRDELAAVPGLTLHEHRRRVVDLRTDPTGAWVVLDDGTELAADAVVLAQGHLDALPTPAEEEVACAAAEHGLTFVPTGYTADLDLAVLQPGEDVLVRGMGLAAVDLVTLLTGGRGGEFDRDAAGTLVYRASGQEPVLHLGSRRGVPYRAKLGYPWAGPPVPLEFFTPHALTEVFGDRPLDLRADLAPVVARELGWAHYTELFRAHPARVTVPWAEFAAAYRAGTADEELVAAAVPDPADRFDLADLDRPLAGLTCSDTQLQSRLREHVRADLVRAADPAHSADSAVFATLLQCHGTVAGLLRDGRLTERSARDDVAGWWMNLFSYLASGPPPPRLEELLALSRAGVVHFLGAGTTVALEGGRWTARSATTGATTRAAALVEARIPGVDLARTTDELLVRMLGRGEVAPQAGRLRVDPRRRVVGAAGDPDERVFAVGFWTSGAPVAAFARPRTNAPFFTQNDGVAQEIWALAAAEAARAA